VPLKGTFSDRPLVYNNNLRSIIDIPFYETFSTPLSIKALALLFLVRLFVYLTQASSLGSLITFVNYFNFNLVVMFVCLVK